MIVATRNMQAGANLGVGRKAGNAAVTQRMARFQMEPRTEAQLIIRRATAADFPPVARIFRDVIATGDCYVHHADTTDAAIFAYWFGDGLPTHVAEVEGRVVGMYRFVPNQIDRGSHVANASFMVDPEARHRGVGHALGLHCLGEARRAGYLAMQFNMVVSTNTRAVALWQRLGFKIVGTLPGAFRHQRLGLVDAFVMYRFL